MKKQGNKVAFFTLGCKLNFSETSTIKRQFQEKGYSIVSFKTEADIYIINTCTVTEHTDKKCRQVIKKAVNNTPDALIIVMGCYSQVSAKDIAGIKGVDLVIGNSEKFDLFKYIDKSFKKGIPRVFSGNIKNSDNFIHSYSLGERTRSFLKVQDGCDYNCSYCTVPIARGKNRNDPVSEVVREARKIAGYGVKEIVLTGVNVGDFGKSTNESFFELISELGKLKEIKQFRISSLEPDLLTDEIIEFVSGTDNFVPHFHIPIQSGCNQILDLMKRRYKRELVFEKISRIKSKIPEACIGLDIITGFPGETEKYFMETYEFLISIYFSYLHVFSFSERKNTSAFNLKDKVLQQVINSRSKTLRRISEIHRHDFYQENLGKNAMALFECVRKNNKMFGFTDNYIKVELEYNSDLTGKIIEVKLKEISKSGNVLAEIG